jgi:IS30 family transposase
MSANARDELLVAIRPQYLERSLGEKKALLDNFVAATGYCRKYAITLLSQGVKRVDTPKERTKKYDKKVCEALIFLWKSANQICSKRLIPFLPSLIKSMEKCGHLELPAEVKEKLLSLSPATADRLLKVERRKYGKGKSTTRAGTLLKKHIPIRTFADWNNVKPGFLEADLVAHCGESPRGPFLNTLTMTDIATGWTELAALPTKRADDVLNAVEQIKSVLPFTMLGFDSDNGSEFINHDMVAWCGKNEITFTRSREYRKNDQAHVEQKNGSIVRRIVGYNRYATSESLEILYGLYRLVRLYTNFFQPCLKLVSKERDGARVHKKYDKALTPYQRVLNSKFIPRELKASLRRHFENLDPLFLLKEIQGLQARLLTTAIKNDTSELRSLAIDSLHPAA